MKKFVFIIIGCWLAICMSACKITSMVSEKPQGNLSQMTEYTQGDFSYKIQADGVKVIRFSGVEESVSIPEQVNGKSVLSLGKDSFYQRKELKSVFLPDSLTSIEDSVFYRCYSLQEITIPKNVQELGTNPFFRCSALTRISVDDENKYYSDIDGVLFNKDKTVLLVYPEGKESESYTIPDTVTQVDNSAFGYCCEELKDIVIPETVTRMPNQALFTNKENLTLHVKKDSSAEKYAIEYNYFFVIY